MWRVMQGILGISVYSFDCKLYIDLLFVLLKTTINSILL